VISIKDIIVKKFGGTSLMSINRIKTIANQIKKSSISNKKLVIVVSAMGSETNNLIDLVNSISKQPAPRELDMLLSTGEQKSIALLTVALNSIGLKAKSFNSHQSRILTNNLHNNARILEINTKEIINALNENYVCVIAGFQGLTSTGDITTLGRGGSDTTAVALSAALDAKICEIYTDVDGVYTTDPNIHSDAKIIEKISYEEMLELSKLGAQVLHPRAVEIASKFSIPLVVKSSFEDGKGTIIREKEKNMEKFNVKGITVDHNIIYFSIEKLPKDPNICYQLINEINKKDISIDMVIQNLKNSEFNDLSFTVSKDHFNQVKKICATFLNQYASSLLQYSSLFSKISIVGIGINNHPEVLADFFQCIASLGLNIECLTTSQMKISCLMNKDFSEKAITALHDLFFSTHLNSKNTAI